MHLIETISLKLDQPPWGPVIRGILGLVLFPAYSIISQGRYPAWGILVFFLLMLAALRMMPLVVRKVLPFSADAQSIWAARRRLAKYYDSYQWRKLFWTGLGAALYLFNSRSTDKFSLGLVGICIIGGAIGLWIWHGVSRKLTPAPTSAK